MKNAERIILYILDKIIFSKVKIKDYNSLRIVLSDKEIDIVFNYCDTHQDVPYEFFQVYKIYILTCYSNHTQVGRDFRKKYGIE